MKNLLLATFMMSAFSSQASTLREEKIKEAMLSRMDTIIEKLEVSVRELKEKDVVNACVKVKEVFDIYPDHVGDIGVHLDPFNIRNVEIKNDSLVELAMLHRQTLECDRGEGGEYVHLKNSSGSLKDIIKSVKKQKRIVKRASTGYSNDFHYEYEY